MTHTPRTLSLVAALLLTLAACNDDLTQTTPTTPGGDLAGQPVQFSTTALSVEPAGSDAHTRAAEAAFPADGATMTVYLLDDGGNLLQQADYTYASGQWASTAPLCWPASTGTYQFTAVSPATMADGCTDGQSLPVSLPDEWDADALARWQSLRVTAQAAEAQPTATAVSLGLHHPLAQIEVVSLSGAPVYLTDAPATGTVTLDGNPTADPTTAGLVQLATTDDLLTYQGYVLPTTTAFGILSDKLLTLTLPTEGLQAGTSLTTTSATDVTIISCTTPGTLADAWPTSNPTKVLITGTLNADDITTLNSHKNEITHLYVTANAKDYTDWEEVYFDSSSSITEIYLAQATYIAQSAFYQIIALNKVNAPKATSIGSSAFMYCTFLTSVNLPQATNISSDAFCGCTSLTSVNLPQATNINDRAFLGCTALTSICLPTGVQFISSPFDYCTSLTTLYLSNYYPEADFDEETYSKYGEHPWTDIYYGYRGTGDYLDPASYTGHWTAPTNP